MTIQGVSVRATRKPTLLVAAAGRGVPEAVHGVEDPRARSSRSRRATRARSTRPAARRCHPSARPRSSRSSSPPPTPTRCRACRTARNAFGCERSHRRRPRCCPMGSRNRSNSHGSPRSRRPSCTSSPCPPARRIPTPTRSADGTPRPSATTATPHRPGRRPRTRSPPGATRGPIPRPMELIATPAARRHARVPLRERHLVHRQRERPRKRHLVHRPLRHRRSRRRSTDTPSGTSPPGS